MLLPVSPERVPLLWVFERHSGDAPVLALVVKIDQYKVLYIGLKPHVAASFAWVSGNLALKAPSLGVVAVNAVVSRSFLVIVSI
jgi:hypothetical protein